MHTERRSALSDRWLTGASLLVVLFALLAALPAFWVPIGMQHEVDAVAYRVPILKWMLRHHAYPNWPWTFVDDYPMLGELLMLPFYAARDTLVRVVPLAFYLASGLLATKITLELFPAPAERRRDAFAFGAATALALHPLLLQSNVVMVDNIAAAFTLGALYLCLRRSPGGSSASVALAIATRYSAWGFFPGIILANLRMELSAPRARAFRGLAITLAAIAGAAPFLIRNQLANGNPFFPLLNEWINGRAVYHFDAWGRGKGLLALLLFPFDLLYTNSFVTPFFDIERRFTLPYYPNDFGFYTVGTLFQAQVSLAGALALFGGVRARAGAAHIFRSPGLQATLLFLLCHFATWWLGSQQLRFLLPELLVANGLLARLLFTRLPKPFLFGLLGLAMVSITATQLHSWKSAAGLSPHLRDLPVVRSTLDCVKRLGLRPGQVVGQSSSALVLGYGDYDFQFLPGNPLYSEPAAGVSPRPDFILDESGRTRMPGYEPWPEKSPCALRRIATLPIESPQQPEMANYPKH